MDHPSLLDFGTASNAAEEIDLLGLNISDNSQNAQNLNNQSSTISSSPSTNLSPYSSVDQQSESLSSFGNVPQSSDRNENTNNTKEEDLDFYNASLLTSARRHKEALEYKKTLERQTQQGHSSLWSFPVNEKTLEGICGCNAVAYYSYRFTVATFNQTLYENLINEFFKLHEHNINAVFMSLFEQTVAELLLSRFIHSQVPKVKSMVCYFFTAFLFCSNDKG